VLNGEGRRWMFRMVAGSTVGHFIKYESRFTFFTEQFASLVIPWRDLDYTVCYYYKVFRYGVPPLTRQLEAPYDCDEQNMYAAMIVGVLPFAVLCMQLVTRGRDKGRFWGTMEMWNFFKNLIVMQLCIVSLVTHWVDWFQYLWIGLAILSAYITFWWDVR
jgi:hypothetical protein